MPPRFSLQGPDPYPTPTPPGPAPFAPPTTVPDQQVGGGPVFGGVEAELTGMLGDTSPVGVGYTQFSDPNWRLPSGRRAWDVGGRDPLVRDIGPRGERLETQSFALVRASIFQMPTPELRALQTRMYDAGYYGNVSKDAVVFGSVDDATYSAYERLLQQTASYNQAGREIAWFDVLDETQRLRKEQGTNLLDNQGPERAPFVARTTAPEDIEAVAQHVARSLLGEKADPALVQQIVAQYRASEVGSQRAAYDAAESGGTVTATPSVEVFAQQAIEEADPTAVTAYRGADQVMQEFTALLDGPFG